MPNLTLEEEIAAAALTSVAFKDKEIVPDPNKTFEIKPPESSLTPNNEPPIVEPPPAVIPPVVEPPIVEPPITPPVSKTFEQELEERSGGKYKSFDAIKAIIDKPAETVDEDVQHLINLKKAGVKFDAEFYALQSKDYEKMTNPMEILIEAERLKPQNSGLDREDLEYLVKDKYKMEEWAPEGEEPTPIQKIQTKLFARDSGIEKDGLIKYKSERTLAKAVDPNIATQQVEQERVRLEKADTFIDSELAAKISKITTVVDGKSKETFDFEVLDSDKKYATELMKKMERNAFSFFDQFIDEKGNFDKSKIYEAIVLLKNREAYAISLNTKAYAKGAEDVTKGIKNTQFEQTPASGTQKPDWRKEAIATVGKNL